MLAETSVVTDEESVVAMELDAAVELSILAVEAADEESPVEVEADVEVEVTAAVLVVEGSTVHEGPSHPPSHAQVPLAQEPCPLHGVPMLQSNKKIFISKYSVI